MISMRDFDSYDVCSQTSTVYLLLNNPQYAGRMIVIVEGDDDKTVYKEFFVEDTVLLHPDGNCDKHEIILNDLNPQYYKRLIAIKDADFDRLNSAVQKFRNLFISDTHDLEGMVLRDGIPTNLSDSDSYRCANVDVYIIKESLRDISLLKWYNNINSCGLNFRDVDVNIPIVDYWHRVVANTASSVSVTYEHFQRFVEDVLTVDLDELTNGHDLFERVYLQAKSADKSNFPKKQFFKRLRSTYTLERFKNTSLYASLVAWPFLEGKVLE